MISIVAACVVVVAVIAGTVGDGFVWVGCGWLVTSTVAVGSVVVAVTLLLIVAIAVVSLAVAKDVGMMTALTLPGGVLIANTSTLAIKMVAASTLPSTMNWRRRRGGGGGDSRSGIPYGDELYSW